MRLRSLATAMVPVLLLGAAAPKLPVIHNDQPEERPVVAETGALIGIAGSGIRNDANTPPGMLAARLAVNGYLFKWTPSPDRSRAVGGADLIDAALSPDESVIVIAEKTGGAEKLNSTRLIFVNLHNHRIIRSALLKEKRLRSIAFLADNSGRLLAAAAAQPQLNAPEEIFIFDPLTEKTTSVGGALPKPVAQCGVSDWAVCYTLQGENALFFVPLDNLRSAPRRIHTLANSPKFALSPDGRELAVFGPDRLERYQFTPDAEPLLLESCETGADFAPSHGFYVGGDNRSLLFLFPGKKNLLRTGKVMQELNDHSSGLASWDRSAKFLICGSEINHGLILYRLPGLNGEKPVAPGKLKPLNRNANFRIFSRSGAQPELILLDHRGNLYTLLIHPRRWKKLELLIVDRTGFK